MNDLKKGKSSAAQSKFEQLTQTHPELADGWFLLGAALQEQGHIDEAISAYQRSLKLDTTILANVGLMEIANERQDWKASLQFAENAINAGGGACGHVQLYWGIAEFHLGNLSAAELAARALGAGAQSYLLLSDTSVKRGDLSQAEQYLREAAKLHSKDDRQAIRAKMDALKQIQEKQRQQSRTDQLPPK
ncbi:MAG: tetratricopeptide repeat protein [Terriglobales bacterium]